MICGCKYDHKMMSGGSKSTSFSESLVLDDSEKGVIITRIRDDTIAAKTGLQAGDEIVAATIHLNHLNKNEVLNILRVLEPYDKEMKVLTKKELGTSAGLSSLGLKDSAEMLNLKKDLSVDASAEAPDISHNGLNGKLKATQGLGGDISSCILNGDLPSVSINKSSADAGAKFTMPSLGLMGPAIEGDEDGALLESKKSEIKAGNLKYKAPKFTMPHFNLPQLKTPKAEIDGAGDADLPSLRGNLETPVLNLSAPKLDPKGPDLDLNGSKVDLNGSDVNLEITNSDTEPGSGKIKWPHPKWKGPKVKGPDADLNTDFSAPGVSFSTSKIERDISKPDFDINLLKAEIKGPDVDAQTPNVDIDAPSGKISWPHLKWKKPNLHGPKADVDLDENLSTPHTHPSVPKVESGINLPDVDINLPKADFKGPDLLVKTPNIEAEAPSSKINWPHLKWKKSKLQGPKANLVIDKNLNTSDLNLSSPSNEGAINILNADLRGPDVDVHVTDLDIDAPSGKINWPHLKWKKNKLPGPKVDVDLNADLRIPDYDLSVPKTDCEISTPDVDLNLPKSNVDIKTPDADIEAPSGEIRFPTLKKPKLLLSGPKAKALDVDLQADADLKTPKLGISSQTLIDGPDVELNSPKAGVVVEASNADINAPSGKFKWSTLKKPKWLVSDPRVNGPDVDLDAKADLESSKLDVKVPDIENPSGKPKWFTFKKPKFGTVKGPKADIDANVKIPDVDPKGADVDLSAPDVNLSAPNIEVGIDDADITISIPNADVRVPDIDLNGPDLDLDPPDGKLKLPILKLPKFKGPKGKGPELDADLRAPDNDPSLDLAKVVNATDVDIKTPHLSSSAEKFDGSLDPPDLDINLPKADLKGHEVDLQAPEGDAAAGKLKLPKINLPKFGFSGPKVKGPNLDVDVDAVLRSHDLDLSVTDIDAKLPRSDLTAPNVDLKAPDLSISGDGTSAPDLNLSLSKAELKGLDVDLKTADVDIDAPSGKLKIPSFTMPKFNTGGRPAKLPNAELKTPDICVPDVDLKSQMTADVKAPNMNLSVPTIIGDLSTSDRDLEADFKTDISLLAPKTNISLPDFKISTPKVNALEGDLNLPKKDLKGPILDLPKADLQVPDPNLKAPDLSLSTPKIDGNLSALNIDTKLPKAELEAHDVTLTAPNMDINLPNVDLKGSDAQLKKMDLAFNSNVGDFKLPHFKLPKFGLSSPEVEFPSDHSSVEAGIEAPKVNMGDAAADANTSVPAIDLSIPKLEGDIKEPEIDVKAPNVDGNLEKSRLPHFKLPKFGFSGPKIKSPEVNTSPDLDVPPDVKVKAPSVEGGINSPDVCGFAPEEKTSLNVADPDFTAEADAEVKDSPKSKLRWPFKRGLKSGSGTDEEESGVDSETDVSGEVEVPVFKFHRLPKNNIDSVGRIGDTLMLSKIDTDAKDYVISKGIRLPIVNATSKAGEKIDIMERLKMAKEKVPSATVSPTKANTDSDFNLAAPNIHVGSSTEAEDSSFREGTFKAQKPESILGVVTPEILTSDENDKLSLSLSNMLGLNVKDSDAD